MGQADIAHDAVEGMVPSEFDECLARGSAVTELNRYGVPRAPESVPQATPTPRCAASASRCESARPVPLLLPVMRNVLVGAHLSVPGTGNQGSVRPR